MKAYILYNPAAGSNCGEAEAKKLNDEIKNKELIYYDITKIQSYEKFFSDISERDEVIVCGGDGTLSRFANDTYYMNIKNPILYYPIGTGNDFAKDMGFDKGCKPILVNHYLKNLPVVTVNGESHRFINAIGFGIDGYACEVGDKLRMAGKKINYVSIVIKGILYAYKPKNATVEVDGKRYDFKRVWFAPTMKGRYYGGGINMTPNQSRDSGKVSVALIHKAFNLVLLPILPTAFKGEHIKYKKFVTILEGDKVNVKFDKPSALQIDGETILNVSEYSVVTDNTKIQKMEKTEIA